MSTTEIPASDARRTASRTVILAAGAALVLLFAATSLLNGAYRRTRLSRAEARYREGLQWAAQGRDTDAAEDFRAALLYEHDDPRYRFALAQSLIALHRWTEAGNYLDELRAADPTSGPVNRMLARIADATGNRETAVEDYHRAIFGYWPELPEENRIATRLELIGILDRAGRPKQALTEILQLADDIPDSDTALRAKAAAMLLAHGSPQHAAEIYRSLAAAHPHDAAVRQGLADTEFALGDYAAARREFQNAVRYGSITPALAARLALLNSIADLDPTQLRLTGSQRFTRARELLTRTAASAARCSATSPGLVQQAQAVLARAGSRREGETAQMLALAQALWKARTDACPGQREPDQPLAILMSRIPAQ
jgi:tetratricopeptide (TPR) repeat protein